MCMLLTRLHYPTRLSNIHNHWGWSPERVSYISAAFSYIHDRWKHLLVWDHARLTPTKLEEYAAAILRKPELPPLQNCIGFIDGTKNPSQDRKDGSEHVIRVINANIAWLIR